MRSGLQEEGVGGLAPRSRGGLRTVPAPAQPERLNPEKVPGTQKRLRDVKWRDWSPYGEVEAEVADSGVASGLEGIDRRPGGPPASRDRSPPGLPARRPSAPLAGPPVGPDQRDGRRPVARQEPGSTFDPDRPRPRPAV